MNKKSVNDTGAHDVAAQQATLHNVYVDEADVGYGVFAARTIGPVSWVLTFEGPRLASTHPLVADDEMGNLLQVGTEAYLLPRPPGALVNHSCDPNAGILDGVHLVTLRRVEAGEEIRFDYATTMDEDHWTMACQCGAPTCRGVVRDFKYLPPEWQQRYLARGVVAPFIARQYQTRGE